ncbi:LOW QUALITY PROTEIN: disks large homolog 5-like [Branchiostoma floridae]|uniref:LOW QUALITY PROTEIN: disks large homolog 5-like n=1 Tax=Branchiostoma floridae TaxID=7739 RepID=A0A9J7KT87_BRAFL|nr:LOW QUALITY PROTEIN: disks large homolog 5-like [Branchiostoma floridae]
MEDKHKELLQLHRAKFVECVKVERLWDTLQGAGVLTPTDVSDIQSSAQDDGGKVEKLLDLLLERGSSAFQSLCVALEKTYPHLLTVMFLGSNQGTPNAGSSQSNVSTCTETDSETEDSSKQLGRSGRYQPVMSGGSKGSKHNTMGSHPAQSDEITLLSLQLQKMQSERDNLRRKIKVYESGSKPLSSHDYERINAQCSEAMAELDSLKRQHVNTVERCDQAIKEADYHRNLENKLMHEQTELRHEMEVLKQHEMEAVSDRNRYLQELSELKRIREEEQQEMEDLRNQQRQVIRESGSSEILNQMYDTAVNKLDDLRKDYDTVRRRYADLMAKYSTSISRLEKAEEDNRRLKAEKEAFQDERNAAINERNCLKQQCTAAIRGYDKALRERDQALEANKQLQQQLDEAKNEVSQAMTMRLNVTKDLARVTEERNAAVQEYQLVMSERDTVHREIEQLQEKLNNTEKMLKETSQNKRATLDEIDSLRRDVDNAHHERDQAVRERSDLLDRCYSEAFNKEKTQKELDEARNRFEMMKQERDIARQERSEALDHRDQILLEFHEAQQKKEAVSTECDQVSKELELMKKRVEALESDLRESLSEAEIAKRRRDWAFQERDKIVSERESIRTLCDKLRRERDRAVSDLAEAMRDSDEYKKQRNDTVREVKELRERLESMLEKEARMKQLMAHHSRDSAIDADSQEWEMETVEFKRDRSDMDMSELGFDIGVGSDDLHSPNDSPIIVTKVNKGSVVDGRLRENDRLLQVNDVPLTNADRSTALQAVRNCGRVINMVVKRRRLSSGKLLQPVHLNLTGGKDIGMSFDSGIFISNIVPGGVAAKEGLSVGDRIININGASVENKSVTEVSRLIQDSGDNIVLHVMKSSISQAPSLLNSSCTSSGHTISDSERRESPRPAFEPIPSTEELSPVKSSEDSPRPSLVAGVNEIDRNSDVVRERDVVKQEVYHSRQDSFRGQTDQYRQDSFHSLHEKQESYHSMHEKQDSYHSMHDLYPPPPMVHDVSPDPHLLPPPDNHHSASRDSQHPLHEQPPPRPEPPRVTIHDSHPDSLHPSLLDCHHASIQEPQCTDYDAPPPCPPPPPESAFEKPFQPTHAHAATTNILPSNVPREKVSKVSSGTWPKIREPTDFAEKQYVNIYMSDRRKLPPKRPGIIGHFSPQEYKRGGPPTPPSRNSSGSFMAKYMHAHQSSDSSNATLTPPTSPNTSSATVSPRQTPPQSTVKKVLPDAVPSVPSRDHVPTSHYATASFDGSVDYSIVSVRDDSVESRQRQRPKSAPSQRQELTYYVDPAGQTFKRTVDVSPQGHPRHLDAMLSPRVSPSTKTINPRVPTDITRYLNPGSQQMPASAASTAVVRIRPTVPVYIANSRPSTASQPRHPPPEYQKQYSYPMDERRSSHSPVSRRDFHPSHEPSPSYDIAITHSRIHPGRLPPERHSFESFHDPAAGIYTSPPNHHSMGSREFAGSNSSTNTFPATKSSRISFPSNSRTISNTRCRVSKTSLETVLSQSDLGDKITMLVQYDPKKYEGKVTSSTTSLPTASGRSTPIGTPASTRTNSPIPSRSLQEFPQPDMSGRMTTPRARSLSPPSYSVALERPHSYPIKERAFAFLKRTSPVQGTGLYIRQFPVIPEETITTPPSEPRFVFLKKTSADLGISLVGGNACGIFVSEVNGPSGLFPADQVLEFNGVNLRQATAEQATMELMKPAEKVTILAQYNLAKFKKIKDLPGDAFYIRVLFDRLAENDGELTMRKDDILFVENTMPQGMMGLWKAWAIDEEGNKIECGLIPSKTALEQELARKKSMSEIAGEEELKSASARRNSATARRSFFRRKKHQRNNSKDSRELGSLSDSVSSESIPIQEAYGSPSHESLPCKWLRSILGSRGDIPSASLVTEDSYGSLASYQRVERLDYHVPRPLVLLGPVWEAVADKLVLDNTDRFTKCVPEVMKVSPQSMEKGLTDNIFVDFRRRGSSFECTTAAAVKEICERSRHSILDIDILAIERLHRLQLYPIVLFMKWKGAKQIRETKDPRFLREKLTNKQAREMFEEGQRLEQDFSRYFTANIAGGSLTSMCEQIRIIVDQEQNKTLWIPSGSL